MRGAPVDRRRLRGYAVYGYPIAASLALAVVLSSTDRFLLAAFMNEAAVGAYHAGYSLANRTLDVLFIWLGAAGAPALIMALERGGGERLKTAAREQASTFLLIGLPAAAGVALVAGPLTEVMIGEDLRRVAASITPWIALSALLSGLTTYYFHQAFTLGRRTGLLLVAMSVPALANIGLNLLLIPAFGVLGAAWATAASFGLGLVASIAIGRRVLVMPMPWETLVRCGLATGAMALVVSALPAPGGLVELMLDASVGALVYAIVALTLNAAGVRDVAGRIVATARNPERTVMTAKGRVFANPTWKVASPVVSVLIPFLRDDPSALLTLLDEEAGAVDGSVEIVVLDDGTRDPELTKRLTAQIKAMTLPARLITLPRNEGGRSGATGWRPRRGAAACCSWTATCGPTTGASCATGPIWWRARIRRWRSAAFPCCRPRTRRALPYTGPWRQSRNACPIRCAPGSPRNTSTPPTCWCGATCSWPRPSIRRSPAGAGRTWNGRCGWPSDSACCTSTIRPPIWGWTPLPIWPGNTNSRPPISPVSSPCIRPSSVPIPAIARRDC